MSTVTTRMHRPDAVAIAKRFVWLIEDTTDRLVVAGSLRRRLAMIGHVEIVAVPTVETRTSVTADLFGETETAVEVDTLDLRLGALLKTDVVAKRCDRNGSPRWGPTLKYLTYDGARVDLFTPSAERFGWILMLRTGPYQFSKQLVVPHGKRTNDGRPGLLPPHLISEGGWLRYRTSREQIPTPDERAVFELFKLAYQEPWERT